MSDAPDSRRSFLEILRSRFAAVAPRIASDTLANRTGGAVVDAVDDAGRPVTGAAIGVEQVAGDVRFGANAFMCGGLGDAALDRRWEELFAGAFDLAVVPFFWSDLEPERGMPRLAVDALARYRRPPPDAVLAFCERQGIEPKGHALTYHQFVPEWMPTDPVACQRLFEDWFSRLGDRYRARIPSWDVVNEPITRWVGGWAGRPVPDDWVAWSFHAFRRHFPGCRGILNEGSEQWTGPYYRSFIREMQPFHLLLELMRVRGVPIDEMGMQYHLFRYTEPELWSEADHLLDPGRLLAAMDSYGHLGLPLHVSEITVPSYGTGAEDEEMQAEIAEMLYRTWFSHASVRSIVWWNVVDGHAHKREAELRGALLGPDLREKPVYSRLRRLIREEWRTTIPAAPRPGGRLAFRGFHGRYRVTASLGPRAAQGVLELRPGREASLRVVLA